MRLQRNLHPLTQPLIPPPILPHIPHQEDNLIRIDVKVQELQEIIIEAKVDIIVISVLGKQM